MSAGPSDGEAWLWASRVAGLREDYEDALRAVVKAESLGVESLMENPAARRMELLARLGRYGVAAVVADSLASVGFFRSIWVTADLLSVDADAWAFAVLISARRWQQTWELLVGGRPPQPVAAVCRRANSLLWEVEDRRLRNAAADTSLRYGIELQGSAVGKCLLDIAVTAARDSIAERQIGSRYLALAESLSLRGDHGLATRFANSALIRDTALAGALRSADWYVERVDRMRLDRRFVPRATLSGDSLILDWERRDQRTLAWDDPDFPYAHGFGFYFSRGDTTFGAWIGHPWPPHDTRREGPLAAFVDELSSRSGYAGVQGRILPGVAPTTVTVSASESGFRAVVLGGVAQALGRWRPEKAGFEHQPCLRDPRAVADRCRVEVTISYR